MVKQIVKKIIPSCFFGFFKKTIKRPDKFEKEISEFIGRGVAPSHIGFLKKITPLIKGKTVLEVGGSNFPRDLLFKTLGVKKWICVDYLENWAKDREASTMGLSQLLDSSKKMNDFMVFPLKDAENNLNACDYLKFHGDATYIPENFYAQFDVVVSVNAFEHILTLPQVIEKIYSCLVKGGTFYTCFGPIWSCMCGHHYAGGKYHGVLKGYDITFNNAGKDGIPPFIHLLKNEKEVREYFKGKKLPFGQAQIDCLCKWSYHTNEINRLFFEDYVEIMAESKFKKYKIKPFFGAKPEEKIFTRLCEKYPNYKHFDVYGVEISAEK